ncbi:MAG: 2-C-methyl-D-erythritol 4-phosphate cytidylyltransferase, partial [Balneolaceae bacterium]|nr:2-C-methyl-D-erythritol 4-phosphate cytidylyltransferase [Balneolaceae bacterium]
MSTFTVALIIPAAGSGERLGRDIPKPFIPVAGRGILAHT